MPFVRIPGLNGKLYVPEDVPTRARKHPCPDCHACQRCSDERCHLCRETAVVPSPGKTCRIRHHPAGAPPRPR